MNVIDLIHEAEASHTTRFAFELLPPLKGAGMEELTANIDRLMPYDPAYITVTYHREVLKERTLADGSIERHVVRRRPGTIGIASAIRQRYGVEVVPHLICGGHSRSDIEDALIDMDFLGLHNVLALRGDARTGEAHFQPHPEGYSHAVELVRQINAMNRGEFIDGEVDEGHHTAFSIAVAGYPEMHGDALSAESDLQYLKEKVDAGADYIITQLFFDNQKFFDFVARCRQQGIHVPIIPGIKPLASVRQLTVLPEIFHCHIPEQLRNEVERHADDKQAVRQIGTEWAIAQSQALKAAGVPVLHYYSMGKADNIIRIAEALF